MPGQFPGSRRFRSFPRPQNPAEAPVRAGLNGKGVGLNSSLYGEVGVAYMCHLLGGRGLSGVKWENGRGLNEV